MVYLAIQCVFMLIAMTLALAFLWIPFVFAVYLAGKHRVRTRWALAFVSAECVALGLATGPFRRVVTWFWSTFN